MQQIYSWDWREYPDVLGPIVDQYYEATCWAVALVRCVQALLNIRVGLQLQEELSIQHVVNNVTYDSEEGIQNIKSGCNFIKNQGVCKESQCPHRGEIERKKCSHREVNCYTINGFTHLTEIENVDLEAMIQRQPVMALINYKV